MKHKELTNLIAEQNRLKAYKPINRGLIRRHGKRKTKRRMSTYRKAYNKLLRIYVMYCEELTYTADNALQRLVQLSCITQGLLEEFTNQRILLKYQIFGQLIAAFDRYLFSYSSQWHILIFISLFAMSPNIMKRINSEDWTYTSFSSHYNASQNGGKLCNEGDVIGHLLIVG